MKIWSEKRKRYYDRIEPEERFWKHVEKTETCWLWTGGWTTRGYGKFNPTNHNGWETSHRFSYRITNGLIPEGKVIGHKCNVKLCVNPEHLYLTTFEGNNADALADGLIPFGEKHGMSKLTESDVKQIRFLYQPRTRSLRFLAKKFGITSTQVRRIIRGETWKHILPTS